MNGVRAAGQVALDRGAELRHTPGGQALLSFSVAVADAERAEGAEPEWVRVSVWGEEAERLHEAGDLVKGAEVYAEGRIRLNEWTRQDGQKRSGLNLSAWKLGLLGALGRRPRPRRTRGQGRSPAGAIGL